MNSSLPPRLLADTLWLRNACARGGQYWVSNAECRVEAVELGGVSLPLNLLERRREAGSYVASPRAAWLDYARHEAARRLAPGWPWLAAQAAGAVLSPLTLLLRQGRLEHAAIVGNHLISTNLYPDWPAAEIRDLGPMLAARYPQRPLLMRNICPAVNPDLAGQLCLSGWQLLPARLVYLCDPAQAGAWKHNHVKQDARLLAGPEVEVIPPQALQIQDLPQLRCLFRQLFIDKHSALNPDFSPEFFELCQETGFLELYGLRYQGRLVGVLGLYPHAASGWLTTPLIGYDTSLPQQLGLYRRLMALLLQQARERQLRLHYSSGAGQFKRARGGVAQLEYTAVYSQHLHGVSRHCNRLLAQTLQILAPPLLTRADQR